MQKKPYEKFFKDAKMLSNKYFTFDHIWDDDNIVIVTNNVTLVNTKFGPSLVLLVDNNKAIYLKDWQVQPVMNYYEDLYAFAVKLNRNFMKTYTFSKDFEGVAFDEEDTFDSLMEIAKTQNDTKVACGWGKCGVEWRIERR